MSAESSFRSDQPRTRDLETQEPAVQRGLNGKFRARVCAATGQETDSNVRSHDRLRTGLSLTLNHPASPATTAVSDETCQSQGYLVAMVRVVASESASSSGSKKFEWSRPWPTRRDWSL